MERKRITCPETAHLEEIELEHTTAGIVIGACSRFSPPCSVACGRDCARRMDRRERQSQDDRHERILIAFGGADAQAAAIARALAGELARDKVIVEVADLETRAAPPPSDYEAVAITSPIRFGRFAPSVSSYVEAHAAELASRPWSMIAVRHGSPRSRRRALEHLIRTARSEPSLSVAFDPTDPLHQIAALAEAIADDLPPI